MAVERVYDMRVDTDRGKNKTPKHTEKKTEDRAQTSNLL